MYLTHNIGSASALPIISPGTNIKKSKAIFCRSTLLLSFCVNRFCLSQFIKKFYSMKRGAFFRHFCVSKLITTAHAPKSSVIYHFFQELSNKKVKALRPNMTKVASRGGGGGPALILLHQWQTRKMCARNTTSRGTGTMSIWEQKVEKPVKRLAFVEPVRCFSVFSMFTFTWQSSGLSAICMSQWTGTHCQFKVKGLIFFKRGLSYVPWEMCRTVGEKQMSSWKTVIHALWTAISCKGYLQIFLMLCWWYGKDSALRFL